MFNSAIAAPPVNCQFNSLVLEMKRFLWLQGLPIVPELYVITNWVDDNPPVGLANKCFDTKAENTMQVKNNSFENRNLEVILLKVPLLIIACIW